ASPTTLAAVMTCRPAVMGLSQNRQTRRYTENFLPIANLFNKDFCAARFRRRQEDAIGGAGNIFLGSKDSDVRLNFVVIRCYVFVADGPVVPHAVGRTGLEIYLGETECDPSPMIRAPADDARPKPQKVRSWRRSVRLTFNGPCAVWRHEFISDNATL